MAYLLDHDYIIFNIEQNPVITHAKTIAEVGLSQPLDVAGKSIFQASYFSDDLGGNCPWQESKVLYSQRRVFDMKSP